MSDETTTGLSRKQAIGRRLAGAGALSLPTFLEPSEALGGDARPLATRRWRSSSARTSCRCRPKSAKVHTSACQYCNVGCGYKIYTWPVSKTPQKPPARPKGALGDWISPALVTRAQVDGKDSYIAVVPDSDCIVNKGDHSPRGGTNALTVYTTRKHPLTKPTERPCYPQARDTQGRARSSASAGTRRSTASPTRSSARSTTAGRPRSGSGAPTTCRPR